MIEPLLVTSSLFLGKEMFTTTVTNTTKNIYNGIEKIILNDNNHFKKILDNLDIIPAQGSIPPRLYAILWNQY